MVYTHVLARGPLSELRTAPWMGTRLLRYVMPYGDTVFNQAQAGDLRDDLRQTRGACLDRSRLNTCGSARC
jgi:hypothetical protein